MANIFMAGTGKVQLFQGTDLVLYAKTLVDSSINLSVSLEDIRAGAGAKLYGKYAHTSGMTMKLTNAMWNMQFLAANIGAVIGTTGGTAIATTSRTVAVDGTIALAAEGANAAIERNALYDGATAKSIWISAKGSDVFTTIDVTTEAATYTAAGFSAGDVVCVKYVKAFDGSNTIKVDANFIPATLTAVLTAQLFSGDASNQSASSLVGYLTITIPRFMLNGTMDLSMTMAGASQMAIEGSALAVESAECDNDIGGDNAYYAQITEVMLNSNWYDNLTGINVENDYREITISAISGTTQAENIEVFGLFRNSIPRLLTLTTNYTLALVGSPTGVALSGKTLTITKASASAGIVTVNATTAGVGAPTYKTALVIKLI